MRSTATIGAGALAATLALACGDSSGTTTAATTIAEPTTTATGTTGTTTTSGGGALQAMFDLFSSSVEIFLDGDTVVIRTDDVPDHPSPYFPTTSPLYEAPPSTMVVNPNRIATQNFTLRIPASPAVSSPSETDLGAIGVATNGVVLFNQYAGRTATGFLPLDNEIATFDPNNGHPAQRGDYHYHFEPVWLTQGNPSALIGVLLDGFPVYGPVDESGSVPSDLDMCNGHEHATSLFPEGIYHYHTTTAFPYISGCYRGAPGSWSN